MKKNWKYEVPIKDYSSCELDQDILNILKNRGIEDTDNFLTTSTNNIKDPFTFKDMDKVVKRIILALNNKEKITIFGDYDVDGVSATAFAILCFKELNKIVDYYIPNRETGYGLNEDVIRNLKTSGTNLIITVDCGINANKELKVAKELNLDVIITDHHIIPEELPEAFAIINPQRLENEYKFPYISGAGTIFMVFYALFKSLNLDVQIIFKYLDLISLGTISDFMPLINENRIFVKYGLKKLENSSIYGLKYLASKVFTNEKELDIKEVSFKLIPVINAAGRISTPDIVIDILTKDNIEECEKLVEKLIKLNKDRQEISKATFEEVEKDLISSHFKKILISYSEKYHKGIIGLISSKVTEKYKKPSIIMSIKEGIATGSARSYNDINILECIDTAKEILIKSGGHKQAAGFSIKEENIDLFKKYLEDYFANLNINYNETIKIDTVINDFKVNLEFYDLLEQLKPYGKGNEEPIFSLNSVKLENIRLIGSKSNHIMFDVYTLNLKLKNCVWFNSEESFKNLNTESFYNIAFKMGENIFNNKRYIKVYIEDMELSVETLKDYKYYLNLYYIKFSMETEIYISSSLLNVGDILHLEKDMKSSISIFKNDRIIGFLKPEISYLLKELNKNFNFKFKIFVKNIIELESIKCIKLEIDRDYPIYTTNVKSILNEIKNNLIGENEYNAIQKKILKSVILDNKSAILVSRRGRGIKTLALSLGMYFKFIKKEKCLYITEKSFSKELNLFYDVSRKFDKKIHDKYSFIFFDESYQECNIKNVIFSEKMIEGENIFLDDFKVPKNLVITDEKDNNIYLKELDKDSKKNILNSFERGLEIKANRTILAILD